MGNGFRWKYRGIGSKIFAIFIITLIFVSTAFVLVIRAQSSTLKRVVGQANELQREVIVETSEATMYEAFSTTLTERTAREARIAGFMLEEIRSKLVFVRNHLFNILERPQFFNYKMPEAPDPSKDGTVSSMIIMAPGVSPSSLEVQAKIAACRDITTTLEDVQRQGNGSSFFIGFPEGFMIIASDKPSEMVYSDGTPLTLDVTQRIWYKEAIGNHKVIFSDVEVDALSGQSEIVCANAIYKDNKLFCVIGANLRITDIAEFMQTTASAESFEVILNRKGHVVFAPEGQNLISASSLHSVYDTMAEYPQFLQYLKDSFELDTTDTEMINIGGRDYYVDSAKIDYADLVIVSIADAEAARAPVKSMISRFEDISRDASEGYSSYFTVASRLMMLFLFFFLILGGAGAIYQARRITLPLKKMAREIEIISGGEFHFELQKLYCTGDEIEVLAKAFEKLTGELDKYVKQATENAAEKERIGTELKVATQIQADMLPSVFPAYPEHLEFDLYASMTPAREVGGDFYDFFFVDENHLAMVMADVSGKGVPAALFMVITKTLIKNRAKMGGSPAEILSYVNHQLCKGNKEAMFVTVWLAIVDIRTGEGLAANAGHEHPALCDSEGNFKLVTYKHSMVIGMMDNIPISEHKFKLEPGATLFVYTDGIPESEDPENNQLGTDRMLGILNRNPSAEPQSIVGSMSEGIRSFTNGAEQFDDITMLCFKYYGSKTRVLETDAERENLDNVLSFIHGYLKDKACPQDVVSSLDLAVEELFVNVATYAYEGDSESGETGRKAEIRVQSLTNPAGVSVSIKDWGKPFNPLEKADPDVTLPGEERSIGGLGIFLVKKAMDSVTYSRTNDCNIITIRKYF